MFSHASWYEQCYHFNTKKLQGENLQTEIEKEQSLIDGTVIKAMGTI